MAYWTACRLQPNRTALALHFLNLQGYEVYCPRLREQRLLRGRLVMDGATPAKVPDAVIAEIRSREREGAIELPPKLRPGDRVRVLHGPFRDQFAIYAGMTGRDWVAVLLRLLGGERRILLHRSDVDM